MTKVKEDYTVEVAIQVYKINSTDTEVIRVYHKTMFVALEWWTKVQHAFDINKIKGVSFWRTDR